MRAVLASVLALLCAALVCGDSTGGAKREFFMKLWYSCVSVFAYPHARPLLVPSGMTCASITDSAQCYVFGLDCTYDVASSTCKNSACFGLADQSACRVNCTALNTTQCANYPV